MFVGGCIICCSNPLEFALENFEDLCNEVDINKLEK